MKIPTIENFIKENIPDLDNVQHKDRRRVKHSLENIEGQFEAIFEKNRYHKPLTREERAILDMLKSLREGIENSLPDY